MHSIHTSFSLEDLDAYNFRSAARRLGRQYRDEELDDTRELNEFIAHYANLLLHDTIAYDGTVTTTLHDERVIITVPDRQNPAYQQSFCLDLRKALSPAPSHGRLYVNAVRDMVASYVCTVAEQAVQIADDHHHHHVDQTPPLTG